MQAMPLPRLLLLLATTPASANKLRLRAKQFQKWRDARFGCGNRWHYWRCSGQLTDPATGVVIARLEGVEATRALRGDARRWARRWHAAHQVKDVILRIASSRVAPQRPRRLDALEPRYNHSRRGVSELPAAAPVVPPAPAAEPRVAPFVKLTRARAELVGTCCCCQE